MNCLSCGRPLRAASSSGWHARCIRRFFGTRDLPQLSLNKDEVERLALDAVGQGYTVPGVQKKLSLHLSADKKLRLTMLNYPTSYILKPQVDDFVALPEAEHLAMSMAQAAGISTVPHGLIRMGDAYAYITKRIDRPMDGGGHMQMLAMEDFCQLDFRLTQDKYRGSYERCARIIRRHSSRGGLDMTELFIRLVFSYLIGNSDMHLKNFSLIETAQGSGEYVLSPAYDLLPVNTIMPEDEEQFALPMNGKKSGIRRKDFLIFAQGCGIADMAAGRMIDKLLSLLPLWLKLCDTSLLPPDMKKALAQLMRQRAGRLQAIHTASE